MARKKRKPVAKKSQNLGTLQEILKTPPMDLAVRQARRNNSSARKRLPSRAGLDKKLTDEGVTRTEYRRLYESSNDSDRKKLRDFAKRAARKTNRRYARELRRRQAKVLSLIYRGTSGRDATSLMSLPEARPGKRETKLAGVGVPSAVEDIGKVVGANVVAAVSDPPDYASKTAKGAARMAISSAAGLGQAAVDAVTRPTVYGTIDADRKRDTYINDIVGDLRRRYGATWEDTLRRVKDEGGAADILDVATVAGGGAAIGGRVAGAAAKAGKLGPKAKQTMTEPRPKLRTGNTSRRQTLSPNYLRALAQRQQDKSRASAMRKHARRSDDGIDATVAEAINRGQVTHARSATRARKQKRQTARLEGVTRLEHRSALAAALRPYRHGVRKLSKRERPALKYAVQYGIRTPEQAKVVLARLLEQWRTNRDDLGRGPEGRFDADELPIVQDLLARADEAFTPAVASLADAVADTGKRAATIDPRLSPDAAVGRARAPQGALLGLRRADADELPDPPAGALPEMRHGGTETGVDFARRVREARKSDPELADLKPGAYWPSEKRGFAKFSNYTRGSSLRQLRGHEKYSGILRDLGMEHGGPETFDAAIGKNFRLAYNRDTVARVVQTQALPWSLTRRSRVGYTARQLERMADDRGLDRKSYVIINPGVYDRVLSERLREQGGDADAADTLGTDPYQGIQAAQDALSHAVSRDYRDVPGAVAIPRAVFDELDASSRPSGRGARAVDKVRGASSAVILGLNPTWPAFSAAGSALQSSLAGTAPWRLVGGKRVWNALSETDRQQLNARLGIGHHEVYNTQRLGSQAPGWAREVTAWRESLYGTKADTALSALNIPKHMFTVDRKAQDAFRRGLAASEAKRAALARMETVAREGGRELERIARLAPEDIARVLRDPEVVDNIATKVNDFLGDYTSYTRAERAVLARYTMFYGWTRFSTKFLLQTMPTQRPLVTLALAQLGQLHTTEVRRLLGDDAPFSSYGKVFFPGDKEVNFARLNPAANALASEDAIGNPARAGIGLALPPVQWGLNQAARENLFTGKEWRLDGRTTPSRVERDMNWRVLLSDALKTAAPYRVANEVVTQGRPQGADSILGDRPTRFKRADIVRSIRRDARERGDTPLWQQVLEQVLPIPRPSKDRAIAESLRRALAAEEGRKRGGAAKKSWGSGWGSSGGWK